MGEALDHVPRHDFAPQPDVVFMSVDPVTGELSSSAGSIVEAFISGTEPREGADDESLGGKP